MALWNLFAAKKDNSEEARRERLLQHGRIVEGTILDSDGAAFDEITQIYYIYCVSGADYESSQTLTADQRARQTQYAPGAKVSIRYDPRQPANSIVV